MHPNEFDESWLVQPDDPIFTHDQPIYLEVTESVPLTHFAYCHSVLREIRGKGVLARSRRPRCGYSNLKYIADLKPEIVKLDRTLIADLAAMIARAGLGSSHRATVPRARRTRRRRRHRAGNRDAGRHRLRRGFGQGYYFAYPAYPAPGVSEAPIEVMRERADRVCLRTGPTGS